MIIRFITPAIIAASLALTASVQSSTLVTSTGTSGLTYFSSTVGYEFTVGSHNLSVTSLGFYKASLGDLYSAPSVGIWTTGGSLVASLTIPLNAFNDGRYLWSDLTSPITLNASTSYLIGTCVGNYSGAYMVSGYPTLSSDVALVGPAGNGQNWVFSAPSLFNVSSQGVVGPNLQYSLAPYIYSQSGTITVSTPLTGDVGLQQIGSGNTILTAQNSYSGGTIVSAGTLVASGPNSPTSSLGTGNITINSGGTLLVNGDNSMGYDASRVVTINAGGTLTINSVNTQHLSPLVLNGGELSSPSNLGPIQQNYGTFNLDYGVKAGGVSTTSIISAQNVTLTQSGGTVFNVSGGANNGVDLLVSGTLNNAPYQTTSTGLLKQGNGVMKLTANNTFSAPTVVNAGTLSLGTTGQLSGTTSVTISTGGTLLLGAANQVNTNATLNLAGGTLNLGGSTNRASAQSFASLTLTANSVIDFANLSGTSSVTFGSIAGLSSNTLSIYNWNGTASWYPTSTTGGVSQYTHLYDLGSLNSDQLANISFYSGSGTGFLGIGQFSGTEIVTVPEPSSVIAGLLLLGSLTFVRRHHRSDRDGNHYKTTTPQRGTTNPTPDKLGM